MSYAQIKKCDKCGLTSASADPKSFYTVPRYFYNDPTLDRDIAEIEVSITIRTDRREDGGYKPTHLCESCLRDAITRAQCSLGFALWSMFRQNSYGIEGEPNGAVDEA